MFLYPPAIVVLGVPRDGTVFNMEMPKISLTPGKKLALVMAVSVFVVMLVSFLWGPASQ